MTLLTYQFSVTNAIGYAKIVCIVATLAAILFFHVPFVDAAGALALAVSALSAAGNFYSADAPTMDSPRIDLKG